MSPISLTFIAFGLSADAFAVAVGKGLTMRRLALRTAVTIAVAFGTFQAVMPLIGWVLGSRVKGLIEHVDHWVAFTLLGTIGAKMLWEARHQTEGDDEERSDGGAAEASNRASGPTLSWRSLLVLSFATSVDALAVGITFALLPIAIVPAVVQIGVITALVSFAGVAIGHRAGARWQRPAELAGGVILFLIGLRILLDHLGVI